MQSADGTHLALTLVDIIVIKGFVRLQPLDGSVDGHVPLDSARSAGVVSRQHSMTVEVPLTSDIISELDGEHCSVPTIAQSPVAQIHNLCCVLPILRHIRTCKHCYLISSVLLALCRGGRTCATGQ